jgi:TRAP-type C4-dicarboxylate transport system permease large subunit
MSRLNEQQQENIRQVFKQTASIRQTAKQTGHGRKAVRRALGYSMVNAPVSRPRTSKLDPYKAKISYLVKEKRLSVVLILGRIRQMGYSGGYTILKDYVRTIRPKSGKLPRPPIDHAPGEEAQMDWSPHAVSLGGMDTLVHTGSIVLCYSRWLHIGTGIILLPLFGYFPEDLEGAAAGLTGMGILFTLLFLGMPIGFGMAIVGFIGMTVIYQGSGPALGMVGIVSCTQAASYMFTVVPMFILMGQFAYHSGISADLFRTGQVWLGRLPGGLAMSSVGGCAGFSAVCGDSLATAVTMGTVALPSMKENKYDMSLATGSLAAGGTPGILIPPSAAFIYYAIVTEESIGQLFLAGIVPGVMLTLIFMITIYLRARINPNLAPAGEATTFREKIISLKGVVGMLSLFMLIMGGILGGFFSPVEGGAVGVAGASLYAAIRRRLTFAMIKTSVMEIGQITPPIGVNVFAINSVAKDVPMERIFAGIVPFFIGMILCVILLVLFPQIALFLPNLLFG